MSSLVDVLAPLNEDGTRATLLRWCKRVGDTVMKDEPLVELETDKVTVEIAAPASGILIEVLKPENSEVTPDEVLARLGPQREAESAQPTAAPAPVLRSPANEAAADNARGALSPSVRRLLSEHSLSAADIVGTGRNGRITANDVLTHVNAASARPRVPAPASPLGDSARIPHSAVRRRVAEHMVRSLANAPHVTTVFEADLSRVLKHRALASADYEARGARLTLTAYFICACVQALRAHPELNATYHTEALQLHGDMNIGVGTALGSKGLIVPVIHRAQTLDLFETARRLHHAVAAARAGTLTPQDVRGGTFTLSNHGVGGSLLAAPIIINQPQVAILGVGKVQRRVCVLQAGDSESIAVRSMCYLTLTIDHRALDAYQANAFLNSVVTTLEQWPEEGRGNTAAELPG